MTELMKKYSLIILISLLLINCNEKKSEKSELKINSIEKIESKPIKKNDTIYNYWQINLDTTITKKDFNYLGKKFKLELKTFSLNDSAIVRNLGGKYFDYSHTMISDLIISTESQKIEKRFDRKDFKETLNESFYKECNLFSTEIDSIIGNEIFMTTELNVPDTDNQWKVEYSVQINKNEINKLKITKTEYIGL